jgi:hypothetical protein
MGTFINTDAFFRWLDAPARERVFQALATEAQRLEDLRDRHRNHNHGEAAQHARDLCENYARALVADRCCGVVKQQFEHAEFRVDVEVD